MRALLLVLTLAACTGTRVEGDCTLTQQITIEYRCAPGGQIGNVRSLPAPAP